MNKIPNWHFGMLNDHKRNDAFRSAIIEKVDRQTKVVDIGAGTGLLSILSAQNGAESVRAYEVNPHMNDVARQVIRGAGADRICLRECMSLEDVLDPGDRGNLLVTETFDCAVIGEGIISTLRHARDNLLATDYDAIPKRVVLLGKLLESPSIRLLNEVSDASGVDVSPLNALQTRGHFPVRLTTWNHEFLSDEFEVLTINLEEEVKAIPDIELIIEPSKAGRADGIVCWFHMTLTDDIQLSTEPNEPSHWMQAFVPFPRSTEVVAGNRCHVTLGIVEDTKIEVKEVRFNQEG